MSGKLFVLFLSAVVCLSVFPSGAGSAATLQIDESMVDDVLPVADFDESFDRLMRSYQPFGQNSPYDMSSAVLTAGTGSVRIEHLKIYGQDYWVDLLVNLDQENVLLEVYDYGTGEPPVSLPRWPYALPEIDFSLTTADAYGPPALIRMYNVGIEGRLYDVDFSLIGDLPFVMTAAQPTGYLHYLPDKLHPDIAVATASETAPVYVPENGLPSACSMNPFAVPWDGENGPQEYWLDYAGEPFLQEMDAHDGILQGVCPVISEDDVVFFARKSFAGTPRGVFSAISDWFSPASLEEKIDACIEQQARVQVAFGSDSNFTSQLVDLAFTVAGSDGLKLSSATLEKIRGAVTDSKDIWASLIANGKVTNEDLSIWITTTVLKTATPEEQDKMIKAVWGNNIPDKVQALAQSAGSASAGQYVTAFKALAEGMAKGAFPVYTAAVKTVVEGVRLAKDALADDSMRFVYDQYKKANGNWNDIEGISVSYGPYKYLTDKVRSILENQGRVADNAAVDAYIKEKLAAMYAREQSIPALKEQLNAAKEVYLDNRNAISSFIANRIGQNSASECDIFQKYLEYINKIKIDIRNSLHQCASLPPTESDIEQEAFSLARYWFRDSMNYIERKRSYQAEKLSWLKVLDCLEVEGVEDTPPSGEGGSWQLTDTIVYTDPSLPDQYECGEHTGSVSNGSFNAYHAYYGKCGDDDDSVSFQGTWSQPPATLVPGQTYSLNMSISGTNQTDWFWDDFIAFTMDDPTIECGFATASRIKIASVEADAHEGTLNDAWSGEFTAPDSGYGLTDDAGHNQFEIKATVREGCVRYIYTLVP